MLNTTRGIEKPPRTIQLLRDLKMLYLEWYGRQFPTPSSCAHALANKRDSQPAPLGALVHIVPLLYVTWLRINDIYIFNYTKCMLLFLFIFFIRFLGIIFTPITGINWLTYMGNSIFETIHEPLPTHIFHQFQNSNWNGRFLLCVYRRFINLCDFFRWSKYLSIKRHNCSSVINFVAYILIEINWTSYPWIMLKFILYSVSNKTT